MAPPYLDSTMSGYLQPYQQPSHYFQPQQMGWTGPNPILYNPSTNFHPALPPQDRHQDTSYSRPEEASSRAQCVDTPEAAQPPSPQKQDSFCFVLDTDPTQRKGRVEMQRIRKHVMHNYLHKERRKTSGPRDARVRGSVVGGGGKKGKHAESGNQAARSLAAPVHTIGVGIPTPQSSCDEMAASISWDSETESTLHPANSRPISQPPFDQAAGLALIPRSATYPTDVDEDEYGNNDTAPSSLDPYSILGFKVSPYHSWLQSTNPAVDLEKLKFACGRRLRSFTMAETWLPTLIRARHSFLSTICISAAHDEAMSRVVFGSTLRGAKKALVYERLIVKSDVHDMINRSLDDPLERVSDATIIAVLNMLNSEMIGCDVGALRTHRLGLNRMVAMRGGLDKLGVGGHLARTVTVTMLVDAVLREDTADDAYMFYARTKAAPPPMDGSLFPESPVYCGPNYDAVSRVMGAESKTVDLLGLLRDMTWTYQAHERPDHVILKRLHGRIWSFEEKLGSNGLSQVDRIYEGVRLTARIYADALVSDVPISQAPCLESAATTQDHAREPALFVEIMRSLMHTNLDSCWKPELCGLLFWIVLVAGTAAKRARVQNLTDTMFWTKEQEKDEEARRWLAAVAVRCSIILGFEHGAVMLGTLTNMLDMQEKLGRRVQTECRTQGIFGPVRSFWAHDGFSGFGGGFRADEKTKLKSAGRKSWS